MRIKLDENIAASAAVRLAALGHDVHTVIEEGLIGRADREVWIAAQTEVRFLITQDLDFRKEFWLHPETLRRAQRILGTATEQETVEVALDMISFRRELLDGTQALAGLQSDPIR